MLLLLLSELILGFFVRIIVIGYWNLIFGAVGRDKIWIDMSSISQSKRDGRTWRPDRFFLLLRRGHRASQVWFLFVWMQAARPHNSRRVFFVDSVKMFCLCLFEMQPCEMKSWNKVTIFEGTIMMFNCLAQYRSSALGFPGNPGMVGFYRTFMQTIYSTCGYTHPVWAVSHAGHCAPPDSMDMLEGKLHFLFIVIEWMYYFSSTREAYHNWSCK